MKTTFQKENGSPNLLCKMNRHVLTHSVLDFVCSIRRAQDLASTWAAFRIGLELLSVRYCCLILLKYLTKMCENVIYINLVLTVIKQCLNQ